MIIQTQYRDVNLTRLKLSFENITLDIHNFIQLRFEVIEEKSDLRHTHLFQVKNNLQLTMENIAEIEKYYANLKAHETPYLLFNCVIDLILNNEWKVDRKIRSEIGWKPHCINDGDKYAQNLRIDKLRIEYRLAPLSVIRQNHIVQRAILNTLFLNRIELLNSIKLSELVRMPKELIKLELDVLEDLGVIHRYEHNLPRKNMSEVYKTIRLTAKGLERFERIHLGYGRSVFIIAWCDERLKWYEKFVIKELKKHGYEGDVQEKKVPKDEIRRDMIERIESCAFVIADLTGGRENCFYELGYAHALHKRSIITRQKKDVEKITTEGDIIWKTTFDINQYKLSVWEDEHDEE
ncbi:MAG: hypothetical protein HOK84_02575, partial [Bacteroidetes bacterium]|nr:hypothetical protein [Bacteroidota bacterium]